MLPLRAFWRSAVAVGALAAIAAGPASAATPTTTRVSVGSTGQQGSSTSNTASLSGDGRFVVWRSASPELVPGDVNGSFDVFLRDRLTGQTRLVDLGPNGEKAASEQYANQPDLSADGRWIAYVSNEPHLVAGPATTGFHVFLFDRTTGLNRLLTTTGSPVTPTISADGGRVAYVDDGQVYAVDTATGTRRTLSVAPNGTTLGDGSSLDPQISGDGRWVTFSTNAKNLAGPDNNATTDVVARDVEGGTTVRISVGAGGTEANKLSRGPAINADGCVVAFASDATNLVSGDVAATKIFRRDRCRGETEVVSLANDGTPGAASSPVHVSDDGCRISFLSQTVVSPPPSANSAAVLRDRCAGLTSRLDVSTSGEAATNGATDAVISPGSGRYITLLSTSKNLAADKTTSTTDVFVRDLATNVGPVANLAVTAAGAHADADASTSSDPDGFRLTGSISWGDETPDQPGLKLGHDYARSGTYTVTVTVTDGDGATAVKAAPVTVTVAAPGGGGGEAGGGGGAGGGGAGGGGGSGGDPGTGGSATPLALTGLTLSRSRFSPAPAKGPAKGKQGGQLSLQLNAPATVTLALDRLLKGHKKGKGCSAAAKRGKRCTLIKPAATTSVALPAGPATLALTGRKGAKALPPGRYRLRVSARAADGSTTSAAPLSITITKAA